MIYFICTCIWLLVVSNCLSRGRNFFEVELDQTYGPSGCRKQSEQRRECFDVRYSPFTMRCNLLLKFPRNITFKQTVGLYCRRSHCVTRRIQTRSGRSTSVLERYPVNKSLRKPKVNVNKSKRKPKVKVNKSQRKPKVKVNKSQRKPKVKVNKSKRKPKFKAIQLSLVTLTKKFCKSSGKHNNILKVNPRSGRACKARNKKIFLLGVKYSWVVTGIQEGDKGSFMARFAFKSTINGRNLVIFQLSKSKGIWKFGSKKNKLKTLYVGVAATLKFTRIGRVIRVVDLRKNILLSPIRFGSIISKMRLFITFSCRKKVSKLRLDDHEVK